MEAPEKGWSQRGSTSGDTGLVLPCLPAVAAGIDSGRAIPSDTDDVLQTRLECLLIPRCCCCHLNLRKIEGGNEQILLLKEMFLI